MVNRLFFKVALATSLMIFKVEFSMEKQEVFLDDYADPYSIVLRWQFREDEALKMLSSAEENKSIIGYSPEDDSIGSFDGIQKQVLTCFDEGYVKIISFLEFRRLFESKTYLGCYKVLSVGGPEIKTDISKVKKKKLKKTRKFLVRVKRLGKK